MRTSLRLGIAASVLAACSSWLGSAAAQSASIEPGSSPSSPSLGFSWGGDSVERDRAPVKGSEADGFRPLAITLNPLTLLLGRYGANAEFLPAKHHALVANPFYGLASITMNDVKTSFTTYGGELGYHYYTGSRGANGFFLGPSFIFMRSHSAEECVTAGCKLGADMDFSTYGMAFDVGGQWVSSGGFTIGGGGGAMYLRSDVSQNGSGGLRFEGILPRVLFTLGYSL
jgi:hypothetical protein